GDMPPPPPTTGGGNPPPPAAGNPASPRVHRRRISRQTMQPPTGAPRPGDPLRELTASQLSDFATGRVAFRERETPATGLGPIFNDVSCFACHSQPAAGGASNIFVVRFGTVHAGVFDPLAELGGTLQQRRAVPGAIREIVPPEATIVARRQTTPLWGMGLIE